MPTEGEDTERVGGEEILRYSPYQEDDHQGDVVRGWKQLGLTAHEVSHPPGVVPAESSQDDVRRARVIVREARPPSSGLEAALHETVTHE